MSDHERRGGKIALVVIAVLALAVLGAYKYREFRALQSAVADLDRHAATMDAETQALRTENEKLRGELNTLTAELATARESWKAQLASLVQKMSDENQRFEQELAAVSDELWKTREALRDEIAHGSTQAKTSLASLQQRIDDLNKKIADLRESVEVAQLYKDADYLVDIHVHCNSRVGRFRMRNTYIGSGAVVDWNGQKVIVTAGHLVHGVDIISIDVRFNNDRLAPEEVQVVGSCECHDLAIFQFKNRNFVYTGKTAKLGNSSALVVGSPVVALGSGAGLPFCLSPKGYVMNLRRGVNDLGTTQPELIEHSSYINPGNSGGPLMLITSGEPEMVGVNVMLIRTYVPPGLSVPIDDVKRDMPAMLNANGKPITHADLPGVGFNDSLQLTDKELDAIGALRPSRDGIMVTAIFGEAAQLAAEKTDGLKVGDIVLTYNGMDMRECHYNKLLNEIRFSSPQSTATFTVLRGIETVTVEVQLSPYAPPPEEH